MRASPLVLLPDLQTKPTACPSADSLSDIACVASNWRLLKWVDSFQHLFRHLNGNFRPRSIFEFMSPKRAYFFKKRILLITQLELKLPVMFLPGKFAQELFSLARGFTLEPLQKLELLICTVLYWFPRFRSRQKNACACET